MRLRLERQRLMLETAQAMFEAGVAAVNERLDADARRDLARAERLVAEIRQRSASPL